jgi:hypothetical protein
LIGRPAHLIAGAAYARLNPQQSIPCGRVTRRQKLPAQLPRPPDAGGGEGRRIAAEACVEPIDHPHQRDAARVVRLVEQPFLDRRCRMQIEQHDAGSCSGSRGVRSRRGRRAPRRSACRCRIRYGAKAAQRSLDMLRWGLIPYWSKDIKVGFANINAKAEGIDSKPVFGKAFERRRCLVPVDSFF